MKNKILKIILIIIMFLIGFGIAKLTNAPDKVVIDEKVVEVNEELENQHLEEIIIKKQAVIEKIEKKEINNALVRKSELQLEIKKSTIEFLDMFEFAPPEMTEDNINKHNNLIKNLNKNPYATLEYFNEVIGESKDDGVRGNLVNLVNKLNINQKDKAGFYASYIEKLEVGVNGNIIDDNSLSLLIAIDYTIENVPPEEIASYIQQAITGKNDVVKSTILDRFSAYYPDIANSFR